MGIMARITEARDRKAYREMRQYHRDLDDYRQAQVDRRWEGAQRRRGYLRAGKRPAR